MLFLCVRTRPSNKKKKTNDNYKFYYGLSHKT